MKIGIIGIGDIAQKAYLPIITIQKGIEIVIYSRNREKLIDIYDKYKSISYVENFDELLSSGIEAAFVHAATHAHFDIVKALLEKGIHVYVDKPVSYEINEIRELFDIAKRENKILRTGFNRRYAPLINDIKPSMKPEIIIFQKNRVHTVSDIRIFVYDDFIHVVDTLRFLMGDIAEKITIKTIVRDESLVALTVQLEGANVIGFGIMHRHSGKNEERLEVISAGEKRVIEDLNSLVIYENMYEIRHKYNDWKPILYRRGFEQIISEFLSDVIYKNCYMTSDNSSLETHELCEKIVEELSASFI